MSVESTAQQRAEFIEVLDAEQNETQSQATALVNHVLTRAEIFYDASGDVYAKVQDGGQVRRLEARGFRDWLMAGFYRARRPPEIE